MTEHVLRLALAALFAASFVAAGCGEAEAPEEPPVVANEPAPGDTAPAKGGTATTPGGGTTAPKPGDAPPTAATPAVVLTGAFVDKDYKGSGKASVLRGAGETKAYLRIEDFATSSGPALRVLLTREASPSNAADVAKGSLDLGALRATSGNLTYDIPEGTKLEEYAGVIVWCADFSVVFTAASLRTP